jgi:trk system potassium uptake protein TrkH
MNLKKNKNKDKDIVKNVNLPGIEIVPDNTADSSANSGDIKSVSQEKLDIIANRLPGVVPEDFSAIQDMNSALSANSRSSKFDDSANKGHNIHSADTISFQKINPTQTGNNENDQKANNTEDVLTSLITLDKESSVESSVEPPVELLEESSVEPPVELLEDSSVNSFVKSSETIGQVDSNKNHEILSQPGYDSSVPFLKKYFILDTFTVLLKYYLRLLYIFTIVLTITGNIPSPGSDSKLWQQIFSLLIISSITLDSIFGYNKKKFLKEYFISYYYDIPIIIAGLIFFKNLSMTSALFIFRQTLKSLRSINGQSLLSRLISSFKLKPAQIIAATFLWIIIIGTLLLTLPVSGAQGKSNGLVNALFTATSATCVTGLAVVDTGTDFSFFGQMVILILFQIGGLGIMTLSTALSVIIFKKMTLSDQTAIGDMLDQSEGNIKIFLKYILSYTFFLEFLGTLILMAVFINTFPDDPLKALYYSVFHSVSAFCNAGFGLFSDSFAGYAGSWAVNITIMFLIIFGGLGFVVIYDVHSNASAFIKNQKYRLSLHTKITLATSGALLLLGGVFFFFSEYSTGFAHLDFMDKIKAAAFQSVTCRTAGFSTVDTCSLSTAGLLFSIMLMFIGASSGSTGGGIKTTTFALLVLRVKSVLSGRDEIEVSGRTIPSIMVSKAISISLLSVLICFIFLLALTMTEDFDFMKSFFEIISAFGTVGLSTGITSSLSVFGKLLITMLMFIGRVGPLTLALALGEKVLKGNFSFPEEKIMVG